MRIGVIGTGTIATAVVRGIAPDGHQITVSARSAANARALAEAFATVAIAENQAVLDASDVVLIGTTGAQADDGACTAHLPPRPHRNLADGRHAAGPCGAPDCPRR